MESRPLVSAIVSTYNSEEFIEGKIEDLLSQTIGDRLEIIIINSGSKQNENLIIEKYCKRHDNFKYILTDKRETIYAAWNRGIKASSGVFITNSNTDDRLRNDALEILANELIQSKEVGLIYADQYESSIKNQTFSSLAKGKIIKFPDYNRIYQLERCIIGSQPMWRASIHFENDIWFDEKYEVCGDQEFEFRVSQIFQIKHLSQPLGIFFKSKGKKNKEYQNIARNIREVEEIQTKYMPIFLDSLKDKELTEIYGSYYYYLLIPLPFYYLLKKGELLLSNSIYPRYFFHSTKFLYYFNIHLLRKMGKNKKMKKLCRRFLRYRDSEVIKKILLTA